MNVRASPLQQSGVVTSVRSDTSATDGYTGTAGLTGSNMQTYTHDQYYKFNQYKGQLGQTDFSVAKRQLANNPLAKSIV
jgi:hypothetical protein